MEIYPKWKLVCKIWLGILKVENTLINKARMLAHLFVKRVLTCIPMSCCNAENGFFGKKKSTLYHKLYICWFLENGGFWVSFPLFRDFAILWLFWYNLGVENFVF